MKKTPKFVPKVLTKKHKVDINNKFYKKTIDKVVFFVEKEVPEEASCIDKC
jgi:hypothetical protein